jgi:hypothetical protein
MRDFYFDPHTKHYTGEQNALKGWCSSIRWADKVLHSDFFHTAQGHPVYMECADNYQDMRERFIALLPRFRATMDLPATAVATFIIDRAIFSLKVFERIIQSPVCHIITWEKNYTRGQWNPKKQSGQCMLERARNHAQDKRCYHFAYIDQRWDQNTQMRQIIVHATNPQGRSVEVASHRRFRAAHQCVLLMFNRWTQENDFKYLEEHFGINQIISYVSIAYEKLKNQLQSKQVLSGSYKALQQQIAQIKKQLKKLLLAEHQYQGRSPRRTRQIAALDAELKNAEDQLSKTQKEVSRLDVLIQEQKVRLDTRNKHLMDALKLIARNAFYQTLEPFKKAYNNYRDDHELFRNLTQAHGFLVETHQHVDAYLLPTINYPPKLKKIIDTILAQLNATNLKMPDASNRTLRLHPGKKTGFEVAIDQDQ